MKLQAITNYIYEIFQLKKTKHNGWYLAHVPAPDSVAEHTLVASQIGYILADMENADPGKVLRMLVFHDNPEARIGDLHRIATRYITNKHGAETLALKNQSQLLPPRVRTTLRDDFSEFEANETLEAKVAKDADYLEQAFQARIYQMAGNQGVANWITNVGKALQTESAKKIWEQLQTTDPIDWAVKLKQVS